jgi:hypothetical protein
MRDVEERVRQVLDERSGDVGFDPQIPTRVIRRSRVWRVFAATSVALTAVASALVLFAGIRVISVQDDPTPPAAGGSPIVDPSPSPTPAVEAWRGVWEYTTREDAEAAQAQVDEGHSPWQTDARAYLEAFATREDGLGWDRVFFGDDVDLSDPQESGPLTVHLGDCPAIENGGDCPHEAIVTIERLLRPDRTGIWLVTVVEGAELPAKSSKLASDPPTDGYVDATIDDPSAPAASMEAAFAKAGLDISVDVIPSSPSLAGTITFIDTPSSFEPIYGPEGSCLLPGGGTRCVIGMRVPADFSGNATIHVNGFPPAGQLYDSVNDAFAPGEALHCSGLRGMTAIEALPVLWTLEVTPIWRTYDDNDSSGGVSKASIKNEFIVDASPRSSATVFLWVQPDRPSPSAYHDALDHDC